MRGKVSLENNGGFVQISLDLGPEGTTEVVPVPETGG
jgi:hypothetical protein